AAEKVQLRPYRGDADPLTDGWGLGSGNADDDLAGRQLAGGGGDALLVLGPRAVDESLGADALDRFHGQRQCDTAGRGLVGDDEIFRADAEDAGLGRAAVE